MRILDKERDDPVSVVSLTGVKKTFHISCGGKSNPVFDSRPLDTGYIKAVIENIKQSALAYDVDENKRGVVLVVSPGQIARFWDCLNRSTMLF